MAVAALAAAGVGLAALSGVAPISADESVPLPPPPPVGSPVNAPPGGGPAKPAEQPPAAPMPPAPPAQPVSPPPVGPAAVARPVPPAQPAPPAEPPAKLLDDAELLALIDAAVTRVRAMPVRSDTHTPWEVMHAMIPFGTGFDVYDAEAKEKINGVRWLLERATFGGKRLFLPAPGGLAAWSAGKPYLTQDHPDQYLSKFGRTGIPLTQKILVDGQDYTVADLFNAAKANISAAQEMGFTLTAMILYGGLDAKWKNAAGEEWDIPKVLKLEVEANLDNEACGGSHGLWGLAHALKAQKAAGRPIEGIWSAAEEKVRRHKLMALAWQGPEGYFSAAFFERAARPPTDIHLLYATGHTLEFLAQACTDEEIRSPALRRAAQLTAAKLMANLENPKLLRGTLYHAVHGLMTYRDRFVSAKK
jgi:hypothetical protein